MIQSDADNTIDGPGGSWQIRFGGVVIVLAGLAAFSNSFDGVFVYDDFVSIRDNPYIEKLWPLSDAMSLPLINDGATVSRRPMLSLSFALNRFFLGSVPWDYHLVNLLIHLSAALLLFGIIRRTLLLAVLRRRCGRQATPFALAVSVIWLVHPLQTESVTYIVQRAESLMGALFLLAVYASLRGFQSGRPRFWYFVSVLACALGMAVKEVMFAAPIIIFLYDATFVSPSFRSAWRTRRWFYTALASTWSILIVFQIMGIEDMSEDFTNRNPLRYALTQPGVILYYLRLCVWPSPLVMDYNWPSANHVGAIVPAGCAILLMLCVTARGLYHQQWYGLLGAWFFLILGPSSSFAALVQNLQPHRMYLSLAAVVVLLMLLGESLIRKALTDRHAGYRGIVCLLLVIATAVVLTVRTRSENANFHSVEQLWRNNIEKWPSSTRAREYLGNLLFSRHDVAGAIEQFREVVVRAPDSPGAHTTLANALFVQGNPVAAIKENQSALVIDSQFWPAYLNLGTLYRNQHQSQLAIENFQKAISILDRGQKLKDYSPAEIAEFRHDAHLTLGALLLEHGERESAISHFRSALQFKPDSQRAGQMLQEAVSKPSKPDA